MKNTIWIISVLLVICLWCNVVQCYHARQADEQVRIDTVEQVAFVEVHDTVPAQTDEKVIKYITIPCSNSKQDTLISGGDIKDSVPNSLTALPVVQKTYSDDSTYTAYVSGIKYGKYPLLDSITVRQKIIERNIIQTVRERQKVSFKIRPAVGVGYGLLGQRIDVYVGVAGVIDF